MSEEENADSLDMWQQFGVIPLGAVRRPAGSSRVPWGAKPERPSMRRAAWI
jgi:hypothetical protein